MRVCYFVDSLSALVSLCEQSEFMRFVDMNQKANRRATHHENRSQHHEKDLDGTIGTEVVSTGQVVAPDLAGVSHDHEVALQHEPTISDIPPRGRKEEGRGLHRQGHHRGHDPEREVLGNV